MSASLRYRYNRPNQWISLIPIFEILLSILKTHPPLTGCYLRRWMDRGRSDKSQQASWPCSDFGFRMTARLTSSCVEYLYSNRRSWLTVLCFFLGSVTEKLRWQNFKLKNRPKVRRTGRGHIHSLEQSFPFVSFSSLSPSSIPHPSDAAFVYLSLIKAGLIYDSCSISFIILIMVIANPYWMFPSFQARCQDLTFITSFNPYSILFGYV